MRIGKSRWKNCLPTVGVSCVLGLLTLALPARAEVIDYIYQSGSNVMASYSGTLDTTDLTTPGAAGGGSYIVASNASQIFSSSTSYLYTGISGPSSWGTGGSFTASSSTGSNFGIAFGDELEAPQFYTSGTAISGSEVFDSETLAAMGLTTGTYTYTWGNGQDADSVVVEIGTAPPAVPEPASASLILLAGVVLAYPVFQRRRAVGAHGA
jgi:hypothetical protein